jgi:hypothetical protein
MRMSALQSAAGGLCCPVFRAAEPFLERFICSCGGTPNAAFSGCGEAHVERKDVKPLTT